MSLFEPSAGEGKGSKASAGKRSDEAFILQFDGGSRGNPGPAGIGVTLSWADGTPAYELGEFLGICTNNVAEYTAFLRGLSAARVMGAKKLLVKSDSELLVRQVNGQYKVKSPDLKPLYQRALSLMSEIGDVAVTHTYREGNTRADELANLAMDAKTKLEPYGPPVELKHEAAKSRRTTKNS